MKKLLLILILLTSVFTSCVNEGAPTYCDIKINELNKHSEDYDNELYSLGEEYFKTLDELEKDNWIREGEECYEEYLINYGSDTTKY
jgi:hypothetical protein